MEMHAVCNAGSRLLTIEINSSNTIVQVRGKCNRMPTRGEIAVLKIWMGQEGLRSAMF